MRPRELGLTPRELEVLEHVAMGADQPRDRRPSSSSAPAPPVSTSRTSWRKLGASNRSEAAAIAHRLGLVP